MKQKLDFMLAALQAVPTDKYSVYIYCNDGSVRFMDMKPLLQDGTVFEPLKDIKVFKDTITIIGETVAWDLEGIRDPYKCIDIAPDDFENLPMVPDPLAKDNGKIT